MTPQGSAITRLERAVQTSNPNLVVAAANELPRPVLLRDAIRVFARLGRGGPRSLSPSGCVPTGPARPGQRSRQDLLRSSARARKLKRLNLGDGFTQEIAAGSIRELARVSIPPAPAPQVRPEHS